MESNNSWRIRLAQIFLGAVIVIALVWVHRTNAGNEPVHLVTDWSHRHVIFSAPHNLGQHVHLLSNPRYVQQLVRRNAKGGGNADLWRWRRAPETTESLQGDWSMNMGNGATVGQFMYPAKYSFDSGTANCGNVVPPLQPDFVVYNTTRPGSATQATVIAYDNIYSGCSGTVPRLTGLTILVPAMRSSPRSQFQARVIRSRSLKPLRQGHQAWFSSNGRRGLARPLVQQSRHP